jgi:tetratricopeptide (TPR) repeat protein
MALYGAAVSSQLASRIQAAVEDYSAFLAILPGTTVAEKDRAWKNMALASTSASAQATVLQNGSWGRLPGNAIVCQAVYDQGKYLFGLKRYDDAITSMEQLVAYLPEGNALRDQARILLDLCLDVKGGK